MSEDDGLLLLELRNKFYEDLSRLIGESVSKVPENLRDDYLESLNETCSLYGSKYNEYVTPYSIELIPGSGISASNDVISLTNESTKMICDFYSEYPGTHYAVLSSLSGMLASKSPHFDDLYEIVFNTLCMLKGNEFNGLCLDRKFLAKFNREDL